MADVKVGKLIKLRQEAIHGASEVVDIRDLGKVYSSNGAISSAASAASGHRNKHLPLASCFVAP